ncbi:MAG TPA: sulfotransferase [Steroidobacteraceae bacterium]|jgi:tetratricopeptide (TPR) repeat protein
MREATQLHVANKVPEAIKAYRDIVARFPRLADAWYNLAVLERQTFHFYEALDSYGRALGAGINRPEEVHLNRSVIYSDVLRDFPAAVRELEQALTLNPGFSPALLNLANLYEDFGDRNQASALYARILMLEPKNYEALARFANVQNARDADGQLIGRLQQTLAGEASAHDRAALGFALGRLLDAKERYPEAFGAYVAANQASRSAAGPEFVPYDAHRQSRFIDRLIAEGTPKAISDSSGEPRPIFVVGMFRSGSTLTEQLIAAVPDVAPGGEIDFLPRLLTYELQPFFEGLAALDTARLNAIADRYRQELRTVSKDAAIVSDKRPDNFLYIGFIKSLFPEAKIVHTTRDPLDNCLSIYFLHLEQRMSYALDLKDIGHYYREYRRLMAHWKAKYPGDIFDFNYDAMVKNPEKELRALYDFLGIAWPGRVPTVQARSAAIRTASVWQVREPLYQRSSGRARHYRPQLEELSRLLADLK